MSLWITFWLIAPQALKGLVRSGPVRLDAVTLTVEVAELYLHSQPGFDDPFPSEAGADLGRTMPNKTLHLIAHRETIWVPRTARDSEDGDGVVLQLDCDVEQSRELEPVAGYGQASLREVTAERAP